MKRLAKYLLITAVLVFASVGCTRDNKNEQITPTPIPNVVWETQSPEGELEIVESSEVPSAIDIFGDSPNKVALTEKQRALYDEYKKQWDINAFKDADPMDVALVYIQLVIDGEWEGEYNLLDFTGYFDNITYQEYYDMIKNEQDFDNPENRRVRIEWIVGMLSQGTFVDEGNGTGKIHFKSVDPDGVDMEKQINMTMQLNKNKDGIWKVRYFPFDYPDEE